MQVTGDCDTCGVVETGVVETEAALHCVKEQIRIGEMESRCLNNF